MTPPKQAWETINLPYGILPTYVTHGLGPSHAGAIGAAS